MDNVSEQRGARNVGAAARTEPADRRREPRARVMVKVTWETAHDFYAGTTDDMSYGGVFIATDAPPDVGSDLTLTITLPSGERVDAQGRVRWIRTVELASDDRPAGCGVAWLASDSSAAIAVRHFLDESRTTSNPSQPAST